MATQIEFYQPTDESAFEELIRDFRAWADTVFVFIGAGFSHSAAGHYFLSKGSDQSWTKKWPTWGELIERFQEALSELKGDAEKVADFAAQHPAIDVAEFLKVDDPTRYGRILRDAFFIDEATLPDPLPPAHRSLVNSGVKTVVTSNYDQLIEFVHTRLRRHRPNVAFDAEQLRDIDPASESMTVIKMHGCISQPSTVVLTREDYARSWTQKQLIFDFIRDKLRRSTCLFIGYSLTDPNFNFIYDQVRYGTGFRTGKTNYAVISAGRRGVTDLVRTYWARRGIRTIAIRDWMSMAGFMQEFCRRVNRPVV